MFDVIGDIHGCYEEFLELTKKLGYSWTEGFPVRRDWAKQYMGKHSFVVYGHTPVTEPRMINETINIDTGCIFGGKLCAFRYPERETVLVPSKQQYNPEKFRSYSD